MDENRQYALKRVTGCLLEQEPQAFSYDKPTSGVASE